MKCLTCDNDDDHAVLHENKKDTLNKTTKEPTKKKLMYETNLLWYADQSSRANHAQRLSWLMFTKLNDHLRKVCLCNHWWPKQSDTYSIKILRISLIYGLIMWYTPCRLLVELWHLLRDKLLTHHRTSDGGRINSDTCHDWVWWHPKLQK